MVAKILLMASYVPTPLQDVLTIFFEKVFTSVVLACDIYFTSRSCHNVGIHN